MTGEVVTWRRKRVASWLLHLLGNRNQVFFHPSQTSQLIPSLPRFYFGQKLLGHSKELRLPRAVVLPHEDLFLCIHLYNH
jgi:hypothetical protein